MGVSGSGKSTIAAMLAHRLHWIYEDGDWFHPKSNIEKMHHGEPLNDADRWPWLHAIADWIDATRQAGNHGVVACSALKRAYRDILIGERRDVRIVYLKGDRDLIARRIAARADHFMPPALLDSQFKALEEPKADERPIVVSIAPHPREIVETIVEKLGIDDLLPSSTRKARRDRRSDPGKCPGIDRWMSRRICSAPSQARRRRCPDATRPRAISHLLIFFALVYVVEGLGQIVGLISQPLNYYLKEVHGWTPVQVTAFFTVFNLPWIIKPVYGLISDFVPLFGYRRKSYLILANIAAIGGYFWVDAALRAERPRDRADAHGLCHGDIEHAVRRGAGGERPAAQRERDFRQSAMALVQHRRHDRRHRRRPARAASRAGFGPACRRRHRRGRAALPSSSAPLFLIPEKKTPSICKGMKDTLHGLMSAFKRRELWIVAAFIFLYYFSPGLSTPLYYHMTDDLKFSQAYIGMLGSIASAGWVVGALLYRRFFDSLTLETLLNLSIALGTVTTAGLPVVLE